MQYTITQYPPSCLVLSIADGYDPTLYNLLDTQYNNGYDYALFIQPHNTTVNTNWLNLRHTHNAKVYYNDQILTLSSSDQFIDDLEYSQPQIQQDKTWSPEMAAIIAQSVTDHTLSFPTMATDTSDLHDSPITTALRDHTPTDATPKSKGKGKGKRKKTPPPDHTPTDDTPPQRTPTPYDNCIACKGNQSKYDPRHTRIPGECKYPHIETPTWTCPGCVNNEGRWTANHTY